MTAWGAPRYWVLAGGKRVAVMPAEVPVRLRSRSPIRTWGYSTILLPKWFRIPMKDPSAPYDPRMEARTRYRQSIPIEQAGDFLTVVEGEIQEVATVVKSGNKSDLSFRAALGWASRGIAEQPDNIVNDSGDERVESLSALRLLQSGGVEVLEVEAMAKMKKRSQEGNCQTTHSEPGRCLLLFRSRQRGRLSGDRQGLLGLARGSPKLLAATIRSGDADSRRVSGLGRNVSLRQRKWSGDGVGPRSSSAGAVRSLRSWGTEVKLLSTGSKEPQIADLMGKKITAGLAEDRWVQVWLQLHVNPGQKRFPEFRNAVGMDQKGYWWIGERGGCGS
jgi:hypothetical protein